MVVNLQLEEIKALTHSWQTESIFYVKAAMLITASGLSEYIVLSSQLFYNKKHFKFSQVFGSNN